MVHLEVEQFQVGELVFLFGVELVELVGLYWLKVELVFLVLYEADGESEKVELVHLECQPYRHQFAYFEVKGKNEE